MRWAEQRDGKSGDRHAHRAGIDRKAHGRRSDVIGTRQRRKDRLRREQVHDREKGRQADHERAQQHSGGVACISIGDNSITGAACVMIGSFALAGRGCDAPLRDSRALGVTVDG